MKARTFLRACVIATLAMLTALAHAQDAYPSRPVKIVIGFGPGSGTDIVARLVAEELGKTFNQVFVVENVQGPPVSVPTTPVAVNPVLQLSVTLAVPNALLICVCVGLHGSVPDAVIEIVGLITSLV